MEPEIEIRDPMARLLGLHITQLHADGLTAEAPLPPEFCNPYGAAHGGYVYALGHMAAALSAEHCLGRQAVVVDVSSQYLCALRTPTARVETRLSRGGRELLVFHARVVDAAGMLCLTQSVLLKAVSFPESPRTQARETIFAAPEDAPVEPRTGLRLPMRAPLFPGACHIFLTGCGETGLRYGFDLFPETCNLYGAAHGALLYTACDAACGGSMGGLLQRKPVTVSSTIRFLSSARNDPLQAEARLLRAGRRLVFYDVDVTDASGKRVAEAQFAMQSVNFPFTQQAKAIYRGKTRL